MPAHVLDHAPLRLDLAAEVPPGIPIDVDERLELDSEAPRIAEDQPVGARNARGTGIEILPRSKGCQLVRSAGLNDPVPAADGPGAAADAITSLENCDAIARPLELVSRDETGDARAQDDD